MFDVVWADPERELVGQRKARKEKEKKDEEARSSAPCSAASTKSGSSAQSRRSHGFFESIWWKKRKNKQGEGSVTSGSRLSTCSEVTGNRASVLVPPNSTANIAKGDSTKARLLRDNFLEASSSSQNQSSQDDSILSKWTTPVSLATILSLDEENEPESKDVKAGSAPAEPKSATIRAKRKSVQLQDAKGCEAGPASLRPSVGLPLRPHSPLLTPASQPQKLSPFPSPPSQSTGSRDPTTRPDSYCSSRLTSPRTPSTASSSVLWNSPDAWGCGKPPASVWAGAESTPPSSCGADDSITQNQDDDSVSLSLDLSGTQREILQMTAASEETYLKRLTEEWLEASDAALYKELEMEKKRWMQSALRSINATPETGQRSILHGHKRILAFFESHATVSYIAALNAAIPVHHMSSAPLSSKLFPNVLPMVFAAVPCMSFPVAPHMFSDIYAQSLPALVSVSDIPLVLRSMHRVMKPTGILHLTLIDPMPVLGTAGPRLQEWMYCHLLPNLERQFRCASPTKDFPTWLQSAKFAIGDEATVVSKFVAVSGQADSTASRLRCLVGQKLWQEVWGPYVTGSRWWWEDADCLRECLQMGTTWEYHLVDAKKKGHVGTGQL